MLNVSDANNMCQDCSGAAMQKESATTMEIFDNLRRVFQAINEYSKVAERTTGLTAHQLWVLKILATTAPMRVSDLARTMHLRPPTVVGILDRLEAKQLIQRSAAKHDRRVVELQLTPQAREIVTGAPEVAQDMLLKGLGELTDEQLLCVEQGMRLMARLLNAEHLTPQPLHS
jgi:MarR family transcriptional regulator, organic hydroperoxide resistance regulator